jgi:membrane protein implicated in regulation of membrane protease activity
VKKIFKNKFFVATLIVVMVIAVALIIEASTAALVAVWFIPSAIVSAVLSKLGATVYAQVVVFLVLSVLLVVFVRKLIAKLMKPKIVATNADLLIGETGVVIEKIDNIAAGGVVKVKGQLWSAKSKEASVIEKDELVEVLAIEGVKLVVKTQR